MKIKITFHNMPHSDPLEQHAKTKLAKLDEFTHNPSDASPRFVELWLKANKLHPHHAVELHLKTPHLDLHAHDEGADMYVVIDSTIDKMVTLIKKEKEKTRDKYRKQDPEKEDFGSDKYNL